jgi:hypothetical protein
MVSTPSSTATKRTAAAAGFTPTAIGSRSSAPATDAEANYRHAVVNFIVQNNLSLRIAASPTFNALLEALNV